MTNAITKPCTKAEAQALTERIRRGVDTLSSDLLLAYESQAWKALEYETWDAYVKGELPIKTRRAYQIIDQERVIAAVREAAGDVQHVAQITARDTAAIKSDLPAVTEEIRTRVEAGEKPEKVTAEVIAERRADKDRAKAERDAQQAEWDREQELARRNLNPEIQRGEAAKHANGARNAAVAGTVPQPKPEPQEHPDAIKAHRDELLEEVVALRSDVVERDRRLAKYDAMVEQYEKGGFEAIIATRDERIRGLLRQVEDISADRAKLAKSRDFWRKAAVDLGYVSPNSQVEIEQPQPDAALIVEAGF